jgi:prepilin-type N-terminal cleavage/methylation domain-containing protein
MKKGFTLIELLIVVAIIAILAAIAVPNFLEAQVRSKVSRVKSDQRSLSTGIEAYFIDNNAYPPSATGGSGNIGSGVNATIPRNPTAAGNVNMNLPNLLPDPKGQLASIWSFAARGTTFVSQVTTPVAYITSLFPDPFMDTKGATFGYFSNVGGWVVWSPGPDTDQATGTNTGVNSTTTIGSGGSYGGSTVETLYDLALAQPSAFWNTSANGFGLIYDATNGTVSRGDVQRFKQ